MLTPRGSRGGRRRGCEPFGRRAGAGQRHIIDKGPCPSLLPQSRAHRLVPPAVSHFPGQGSLYQHQLSSEQCLPKCVLWSTCPYLVKNVVSHGTPERPLGESHHRLGEVL